MTDGAALDVTTPVGKVRLLTGDSVRDTEGKYRYWSDAELTAFLELGGGNAHLGAAQAYTQLAATIGLSEGNRTYRTADLGLGGTGPGGDIRLIAREWRYIGEQVRQIEAEDYAEFVAGPSIGYNVI